MATGYVSHPDYQRHHTGGGHPECPARLASIEAAVDAAGLRETLHAIAPRAATDADLLRCHTPALLQRIATACQRPQNALDADTIVCADSDRIARLAAGGVLAACDAVMRGEVANAFCAHRPPGHHAEPDRAMGFCLYNHVAVAAAYLRAEHGIERVLILDWDVHHGNGTQAAFWDDPTVLYISMHQAPFYPGTGWAEETGGPDAPDSILNIPMRAGTTDAEWLAAFTGQAMPAARAFAPEFVLISAGFDAHGSDPLGGMRLTVDAYRRMTDCLLELAAETASGRLVSVLEGGYDLAALAACSVAHLQQLSQRG